MRVPVQLRRASGTMPAVPATTSPSAACLECDDGDVEARLELLEARVESRIGVLESGMAVLAAEVQQVRDGHDRVLKVLLDVQGAIHRLERHAGTA